MDITRREFLGYTAGAVSVMGLPIQELAAGEPRTRQFPRWWTVYSDPNSYDSESMRGYWSAIPPQYSQASVGDPRPLERCALLIAPSCVSLLPPMLEWLTRALNGGTTVVMETGAGFASHRTFRQHRRWLREQLGIHVAAPVDLWANAYERAPYIEFTWPRRVKIRDFSRVVPPAGGAGDDVIAWAGDLAVATRRRVGKGTLIYLGSPVGPAIWAGDVEARRWLHAVAHAA